MESTSRTPSRHRSIHAPMATEGQMLSGDWAVLSSATQAALHMAEMDGRSGAAWTAGMLKSQEHSTWMPTVDLPRLERTMVVEQNGEAALSGLMRISIAPNPASDMALVATPKEFVGRSLELSDATGRFVAKLLIASGGLTELHVRSLEPGLYHLRVSGTSEEGSLSVVR